MLVSDLLNPDRILVSAHATSKKRLLELVSTALAGNDDTAASREIFESLIARERLGSTGLGNGVAIPHGRISGSDGVQAAFVRLARPLDFDAIDGKPVDLLFALAVPEHCTGDHLKLLSQIAELFSDEPFLQKLRDASDCSELLQLLSSTKH
jgi:PTS system nitrogen regulatory IIA component